MNKDFGLKKLNFIFFKPSNLGMLPPMFYHNIEYILPLLFHSFVCLNMEKNKGIKKYFRVFHGQADPNLLEIFIAYYAE